MKRSLGAMALGTFALGIAEFGMISILGDVALDMDNDACRSRNGGG